MVPRRDIWLFRLLKMEWSYAMGSIISLPEWRMRKQAARLGERIRSENGITYTVTLLGLNREHI
jgi:hypothetical protein